MPEDDVTYADVKFTRQQTNDQFPSSDDTTYSAVKIVKSEQPVCDISSQKQAGSNRKSPVTSERAALLVLSLLLVAAVIALGATAFNNANPKEYEKLKALKEENEALRKNLSELISGSTAQTCRPPPPSPPPSTCPPSGVSNNERCLKCRAGWKHDGGKCYFNTTKSSWNESRDGCRGKGGDLVKIDSREEQIFLEATLRHEMKEDEDKFWIGLTDSEEEGRWLWADGSSLETCLSFWSVNEPDNLSGEDCVRMGVKGGAHEAKCWFHSSCNISLKSICEKEAKTRWS